MQAASLQTQIDQKNAESKALKDQIANTEADLRRKQNEAASLKNQISINDQDIDKTQLEIEQKQTDIDKTNLEIQQTEERIKDTNAKIAHNKDLIGELIRTINEYDNTSPMTVLLSADESFSDVFNRTQYVQNIQDQVKDVLDAVKNLKSELEFQNQQLAVKKGDLEKEKVALEDQKKSLDAKRANNAQLLAQTQQDEAKYQDLLKDAQSQFASSNAEIAALERRQREENLRRGESNFDGVFRWPLPSGVGVITCGFHCANYFPGMVHTGTDIAASTGTPVYSATDGVVAHAGWSSNHGGYGYYVAISSGQYFIIYGHMNPGSGLPHGEGDVVSKGTVIGYVGCTGFCSGPHLHFEVRDSGTPVNAMNFF